jgi:CheY-like chemotaxis protein
LIEPLFERQELRVWVSIPPALPSVRADRVLARQLFISALSWLAHGLAGCEATVRASKLASQVTVQFVRPAPAPAQNAAAEGVEGGIGGEDENDELDTIQQLAGALGLAVVLTCGAAGEQTLEIRLAAGETKSVLLIEDNPDAVELVQRYLEGNGEFHVVPVSRPGDALKRAAEVQPACIVLDVMMPEHDGWEVLTALKSNPVTSHIPVIISSVVRGNELARALGADGVLPKPFSAAELIAGLRAATRRSSSPPTAAATQTTGR